MCLHDWTKISPIVRNSTPIATKDVFFSRFVNVGIADGSANVLTDRIFLMQECKTRQPLATSSASCVCSLRLSSAVLGYGGNKSPHSWSPVSCT